MRRSGTRCRWPNNTARTGFGSSTSATSKATNSRSNTSWSLAWDTDRWTNTNLNEFTRLWAAREFGPAHAADIADILEKYTKYNGRRKPELLEPATYSLDHYQEAERVVADFQAISARAEEIFRQLPPEKQDAFYELVLFPVKASAQLNEMYLAANQNARLRPPGPRQRQ